MTEPTSDPRSGETSASSRVIFRNRDPSLVVRDVTQWATREVHEPFSGHGFPGVRLLFVTIPDVIEEFEDAFVVVKRQRPGQHFAVEIDCADSLRGGF